MTSIIAEAGPAAGLSASRKLTRNASQKQSTRTVAAQERVTPQSETGLLAPCLGAISGFARACGKMAAYIRAEAISGV
jgi:hypothetical protein